MVNYVGRDDIIDFTLNKDVSSRAIPIDKQWEFVELIYREIASGNAEQSPVPGLAAAWDKGAGWDQMERGAALRKLAETPLGALVFCLQMDFYPPPELAFVVSGAYLTYRYGCGEISLEEAMHGKPQQKAGTVAKRRQKKLRDLRISGEFCHAISIGKTRTEAAEHAQNTVPGAPDADSILRMMRGRPFNYTTTSKRKNKT